MVYPKTVYKKKQNKHIEKYLSFFLRIESLTRSKSYVLLTMGMDLELTPD